MKQPKNWIAKKMTPAVKALDTFMREHHQLGYSGRYDPKRGVVADKWTLYTVLFVMAKRLDEGDLEGARALLVHLDLFEHYLRFQDRRKLHMENLLNSFAKDRLDKAKLHLYRVRKLVPITAADDNYPDGQKVSIIRTEHGWFDHAVSGTIVPGSGGYQVCADGEDCYYEKGRGRRPLGRDHHG